MSISKTLRQAVRLQEKIDQLRGQLTAVLNQARAEMDSKAKEEISTVLRGSRRPGRLQATVPRKDVANGRGHPVEPAGTNHRRKRGGAPAVKLRPPRAGQKRPASPSGPLAPAVVKILRSSGEAMNVRDILDGLFSSGYQFNSPEPKKNLAARIYRLKGVKQVSVGLFGLA